MKRPGLTPSLVSATLFLILSPGVRVSAQEMMSAPPGAMSSKRAEDLLKRYDKNGDGKLDDDERADAKEMMVKEQVDRQMARFTALPGGLEQFRAQALQMFDRNRDGQLDDRERNEAQEFLTRYQEGVVAAEALNQRFDQNGDGTIDAAERATLENYVAALRGFGNAQMRGELLRRFDQNADGKIDEGELTGLEKFVRPRVEGSAVQLRRYDTDRDGKLSPAEWALARSAIAQWLNASGPAALDSELMRPDEARGAATDRTSRGAEQARLNAVAAEVARRRALREGAMNVNGNPK